MFPKHEDEPKLLKYLEGIFHYVVIFLIFMIIVVIGKEILISLNGLLTADIGKLLNDILFLLILIELFTILYAYLKEHSIKVERIVELGIIAVVRETIFRMDEMPIDRIYAFSAFLVVLAVIFFVERKYCEDGKCYKKNGNEKR